MQRLIGFLVLLSAFMQLSAQQNPGVKSLSLQLPVPDSIQLDSFTVDPADIKIILPDGTPADTSYFRFDISKGLLFFKKEKFPTAGELRISWKAMSVNLSKPYKHKDTTLLFPELNNYYNPFDATNTGTAGSWLETDGLDKTGSITRGFSVGNRQDFSLSSSLNLMLNGKLSNDLEIQAAISDNNIPIQPEGNTQQIQEFDKIFIRLSKEKNIFTAGDIEVQSAPQSYFLKYNRKSQGGDFQTTFSPGLTKNDELFVRANGSFGKGRYTRQEITAIESNHGPYKLKGNNNETFIIVLAGSEKVYIDGTLLTRGEDNDYIIDYNTAELTFTTKVIITSKSRISVEFEYSDKNYSRSLITSEVGYKSGKFTTGLSLYSESDLKNQSVQQDLSDEQKMIMSLVGDSIQNAYSLGIDSIGFTTERVMYAMVDTLGYDSVFVYSTSTDSALYALTFSYVGKNNGNYVQTGSSANGRVFKWVSPIAGIPQGEYEPVIILITPKKTEMYAFRAGYDFSKNTSLHAEYAISNKDINLFSSLNDADNAGHALTLNFRSHQEIGNDTVKKWMLATNIRTEITDRNFNEIDRFRSIEFARDWNLDLMEKRGNTYFGLADIVLQNSKSEKIRLSTGAFMRDSKNASYQNLLQINKNWKNTILRSTAVYLASPTSNRNTDFFQYQNKLEQKFGKFALGAEANGESKQMHSADSNLLNAGSFNWWLTKFYTGYADSSRSAKVYYQYREDKVADSLQLVPQSYMTDIGFESTGQIAENNQILLRAIYREVIYKTGTTPNEEFLLGRLEYSGRIKKRFMVFGASYEAGSGMEAKKEFSYLEVAPGQGVYTWNDYNGNSIRELNEFEAAAFSDEANFIRIYTPTNDYIRVFSSQLNGNFAVTPADILKKEKFMGKQISKFSNRSAFSYDKKTSSEIASEMYLPFTTKGEDSLLVTQNATWRNVLTFKANDSRFSINWINTSNRARGLFTNGIEDRQGQQDEIKISKSFVNSWVTELSAISGVRDFTSEYFTSNNYSIEETGIKPSLSWQPGTTFRWTMLFQYSEKNNVLSVEKAIVRKAGTELKFSKSGKGLAMLQFNMLQISYGGETNSSLGYIMLEGLQPGRNFTWGLSIQRTLGSNMQLNFIYDGRASEGNPVVHTGNVQVRVFF
ncbi:MAG: hypothetical protein A2W93_00925 [Bacteroidetes bacterium GWF2_43_63]|nr:MAG: hypothetical protein A2W94_15010 [Bacteroidetes bacterium GWE2_42_42]OFY54156.1 MAG: hypothetical protein A2W93_00925 [Bacteroidetes bacterium GWF2_43_63]HBG70804.1 hypothetical protein [Bacteroidales bacterium]HCB61708.1 hypothetical protein [Bacteroidales bacterium]HCY22084.1 hypothetical protein [Bacteroidales bacterium]